MNFIYCDVFKMCWKEDCFYDYNHEFHYLLRAGYQIQPVSLSLITIKWPGNEYGTHKINLLEFVFILFGIHSRWKFSIYVGKIGLSFPNASHVLFNFYLNKKNPQIVKQSGTLQSSITIFFKVHFLTNSFVAKIFLISRNKPKHENYLVPQFKPVEHRWRWLRRISSMFSFIMFCIFLLQV